MSELQNNTAPNWLPSGFFVTHDVTHCVTPARQLTSFALYNIVAIVSFLLLGNAWVSSLLTPWKKPQKVVDQRWSFWSALATLSLQILGIVVSSLLIRDSGYKASIWSLMQLWALRPRASWVIAQFARLNRRHGLRNGALGNIFTEVFVCGLASVFLGRMLHAAFTAPQNTTPTVWWYVIVVAGIIMLASTGLEMVWALWMAKRLLEQMGRAEAQDINSLVWISRLVIPATAICSWLVWAAFLESTKGIYCPGTIKWVDVLWGVVPAVANIARHVIESLTQ